MLYGMLGIFTNRLRNEHKVIDIESDTAADFSIMVTYLPKTATEQDIKTFFETKFEVECSQISMAYDVDRLLKLEAEKDALYHRLVNMVG